MTEGPRLLVMVMAAFAAFGAQGAPSRCHGTVGHGSIENSVQLPGRGPNFTAYSTLAASMGRTCVRAPYELLSNSCLHFMKEVADAGGADLPTVIAPQPAGYIVQVRMVKNELNYDPKGELSIEGAELP